MSNPDSDTPPPVQGAFRGTVNQAPSSPAPLGGYPQPLPDLELCADPDRAPHLCAPVAVWWDARGLRGPPTDAGTRPSSHPGVNAGPDPQLTVLLAVTPGPGSAVRAEATVSGELDMGTISTLRAAVKAVATAAHPHPTQPLVLVLDLQGVTFLDSSGLHLLEELHAHVVEQGWALRVVPPTAPAPRRLFRLAASRGWLPPNLVRARLPAPRTDCLPPSPEQHPAHTT